MKLRFLTGNAGKVAELQAMVAPLGWTVEPDGRGYLEIQADTLDEVANAGADALLAEGLRPPFILEDSGLFIEALGGFPGVYSAFAMKTVGCDGVLRLMSGQENRRAAFQTTLLYVDADGARHLFRGRCPGTILADAAGAGGFGYDPIFAAEGETRSFAEFSRDEKAAVSHRGEAVRAFVAALSKTANP